MNSTGRDGEVLCTICKKEEVVYKTPVRIDLSRRNSIYRQFCKDCFCAYIKQKAFSEFDKLGLKSQESILVACSGECDSAFMLTLLKEYKNNNNLSFKLNAVLVCHDSSDVSKSRECAAKALADSLEVPLFLLDAKTITGQDADDYYNMFQLPYDLNEYNRCVICGDIRDILLYAFRKEITSDFLVVGRNKDDEVADSVLQLISPPHSISIHKSQGFLKYPIREFTDEEIRKYINLKSIPHSLTRCKYESVMARREVHAWIKEGEKNIYELSTRLYRFSNSISMNMDEEYYECPSCGFPRMISKSCRGCGLLKRYSLSSCEIKNSIRKIIKNGGDYN